MGYVYQLKAGSKMPDMLPQEIAEKLKPMEYVDLCTKVQEKFHQKFGVIHITRKPSGAVWIIIALEDNTRHTVIL